MSAHSDTGHPHGLDNPDTSHEHADINIRAVAGFVIALTVIVVVIDVAMLGMFRVLQRYERAYDPYITPLAQAPGQPFPGPTLQTTPWTDLKAFRAEQQSYLEGYGWVDEKLGVARIPIAKAKEMLLKRGVPVRPELAEATEGTHVAATGESNGGRTIPAGGPDRSSRPAPAAAPAAPTAPTKPGGGL